MHHIADSEPEPSQWVRYTLLAVKHTMQAGYTIIMFYPNKSTVNIYFVFLLSMSALVCLVAANTLQKMQGMFFFVM